MKKYLSVLAALLLAGSVVAQTADDEKSAEKEKAEKVETLKKTIQEGKDAKKELRELDPRKVFAPAVGWGSEGFFLDAPFFLSHGGMAPAYLGLEFSGKNKETTVSIKAGADLEVSEYFSIPLGLAVGYRTPMRFKDNLETKETFGDPNFSRLIFSFTPAMELHLQKFFFLLEAEAGISVPPIEKTTDTRQHFALKAGIGYSF